MSDIPYKDIYTFDYFADADGVHSWRSRALKFGDAFAAVCYLHDIIPPSGWDQWAALYKHFPKSGKLGRSPFICNHTEKCWCAETHGYTIEDQMAFIMTYKKRTPKKILEIGSGRGDVAIFLAKMGYEVVAIEPSPGAAEWFDLTSEHFRRDSKGVVTLLNGCADEFVNHEALEGIDSVIMVETLEHILEKDFKMMYEKILEVLPNDGRFIITNWIDYHPIEIGNRSWESSMHISIEEHCRVVDDALYDSMIEDFGKCLHREGSHIVLAPTLK